MIGHISIGENNFGIVRSCMKGFCLLIQSKKIIIKLNGWVAKVMSRGDATSVTHIEYSMR